MVSSFISRSPVSVRIVLAILALLMTSGAGNLAVAQTQRGPSDVVREFYKAMREHRFRDAFSLTIYKPAVQDLSAEEMEDLRTDFEEKAAQIPEQIQITGEQISGKTATVFVVVPARDNTPQVTSEPVVLILSGGNWIIGDEANDAIVKKAGRRYFLDALISEHESDVEDLLKRLISMQLAYTTQHKGLYGDLPALIGMGLIAKEVGDPIAMGYKIHITVAQDGKSYVAGAEPTRYGHSGKLSFWMDQTGLIKSLDNGGKPIK